MSELKSNNPWGKEEAKDDKTWGRMFTIPKSENDADGWCQAGAASAVYISITFFFRAFFYEEGETDLLLVACGAGLVYLLVAYFLMKGNRLMGTINFIVHIVNVAPLLYAYIVLAGFAVKPPFVPVIAAIFSIHGLVGPFLLKKFQKNKIQNNTRKDPKID